MTEENIKKTFHISEKTCILPNCKGKKSVYIQTKISMSGRSATLL